jgi:hypothetical protein
MHDFFSLTVFAVHTFLRWFDEFFSSFLVIFCFRSLLVDASTSCHSPAKMSVQIAWNAFDMLAECPERFKMATTRIKAFAKMKTTVYAPLSDTTQWMVIKLFYLVTKSIMIYHYFLCYLFYFSFSRTKCSFLLKNWARYIYNIQIAKWKK